MSDFDESPRSPKKGKTFGIGWKNYERVHIDHRKDVYSGHLTNDNPPAKYDGTYFFWFLVREKPGKHKKAFSTYGRLKMFTSRMSDMKKGIPGPEHEINDRHLYMMHGLN